MVRTPKSGKGVRGFGRQRTGPKKTAAQKQDQTAGRLLRSMIEKQVRQESESGARKGARPMTEGEINVEIKRRITERKKPKPKEDTGYIRYR